MMFYPQFPILTLRNVDKYKKTNKNVDNFFKVLDTLGWMYYNIES